MRVRHHTLLCAIAISGVLAAVSATSASQAQGPVPGVRWSGTADSLELAIRDLVETFGSKYPRGREYLERLERLRKAGPRTGDAGLAGLAREALLANPLLDFRRLVFVKRPHFGGHDGFFG